MLVTKIFGWVQLVFSIILLTLVGYNILMIRNVLKMIPDIFGRDVPYGILEILRSIRTSLTIFLIIFGILVFLILLQGILNIRRRKNE